jgi:branched-chain amino acid transport system permease protein
LDPSLLLQFFFSGVTSGSVYALIGISLVIVYRVSRVVCFAQGEFFVIGGLTMSSLASAGIPLLLAFPITLAVTIVLGGMLQQAFIRPLRNASVGTLITMTIAIALVLRGSSLLIWGREAQVLRPFTSAEPIQLMGASLQPQVLWIVGISVVVLGLMWLFFERTTAGIAMRACAENPLGAKLMGISVERYTAFAWAWGASLGALAGIVVAPLLFLDYSAGIMPMVKGFIAMAIGGMSSIVGAVVAGFLLGFMESYTIGLISSKFSDTVVFTLLILVLLFKPSGLFTRR